jgi:hypothetical protein
MKKITFKKRKPRKSIAENVAARIARNRTGAELRAILSIDSPTREKMRQTQ